MFKRSTGKKWHVTRDDDDDNNNNNNNNNKIFMLAQARTSTPDSSPVAAHSDPPGARSCGKSHLPFQQWTSGLNPLTFDRMTIKFSSFSWADRPPGKDDRNQARKAPVSLVTVIRIGVLLIYCPFGKQVSVTWACGVVPSGLLLRDPDLSLDV